MIPYTILISDLDGTLITTASGKTFAEDLTDFRIRKDVLDKINEIPRLFAIIIVTNQGGIPQYISKEEFELKLKTIQFFIKEYTNKNVVTRYCASLDKNDPRRKPNIGMLEETVGKFCDWMKGAILMIGDASGKPGQFSDSDKKTAENFGIDYMDVEDFLQLTNEQTDNEQEAEKGEEEI